jgi:hypothetical protein
MRTRVSFRGGAFPGARARSWRTRPAGKITSLTRISGRWSFRGAEISDPLLTETTKLKGDLTVAEPKQGDWSTFDFAEQAGKKYHRAPPDHKADKDKD